VDLFVILDDVNFKKKSFMSRNYFDPDKKEIFSIPLHKPSQNIKINDILLSYEFNNWKDKFLKTLYHKYNKEVNFKNAISVIEKTFEYSGNRLSELSTLSLKNVSEYLGIETNFCYSSELHTDGKFDLKLINICNKVGSKTYINSIGGLSLYSKDEFKNNGVNLMFLESNCNYEYRSIIDVIMRVDKEEIKKNLMEFKLI
jgi:hypothetical protein